MGFGPNPLWNNLTHYVMYMKLFILKIYENLDYNLEKNAMFFDSPVYIGSRFADLP